MTKTNQKIPEGWSVKKLKDISFVITGTTPPTSNKDNYDGDYLFVSPSDIKDDVKYITQTEKKLSTEGLKFCRPIKKGSVLFVCIGSTIGKIAVAGKDLVTNQQINSCIIKNGFDNFFLYYALSLLSKRIKLLAGEQAVPIINKSTFEKIKLFLPPLAEQEKIAEILGTWDTAIEKLSALIEQKKQLKKGLMQRLLTGKQRLPGFSTPLKKVKLGEITCQISKSVGDLKIQTASISSKTGFVPQTEKFGRDISGEQYSKYTLIEKGDFSYNKGNSKTYPQGCAYRLKDFERIAVPNVFISFKAKEDILCPEFIEQFFIGNFHGRLLRKVITSSVRDNGLLNLNVNDFFGIPIYLPASLSEQKAIADILSKADEEITLLTEKLSALKTQKTGLMQQLLTGKIRVKVA